MTEGEVAAVAEAAPVAEPVEATPEPEAPLTRAEVQALIKGVQDEARAASGRANKAISTEQAIALIQQYQGAKYDALLDVLSQADEPDDPKPPSLREKVQQREQQVTAKPDPATDQVALQQYYQQFALGTLQASGVDVEGFLAAAHEDRSLDGKGRTFEEMAMDAIAKGIKWQAAQRAGSRAGKSTPKEPPANAGTVTPAKPKTIGEARQLHATHQISTPQMREYLRTLPE